MNRRLLAWAAALSLLAFPFVGSEGQEPAKEKAAKAVFGLAKVWSIHLEISAKEYETMQPSPAFGPTGPAAPKGKRDSEVNLFGTQFPWVEGDFTAEGEGKTYKKVGIRYDGNVTYFASAQILKRPLKIDFNKFGDQHFHGLASLHFHAMPMDPAKGREVLAYSIFRAAGVPAPRTGFAELTLTVPEKYTKEHVGLYAVVENVDAAFLSDRFGSPPGAGGEQRGGLLMKPFQVKSLDYLGEDWEAYQGKYRSQSEPTKDQTKRVIDFARLVNQAKDDEFKKEIGGYLELDGFLRFLAANAITSNLESSFALGHNYYLYLHPKTNKFAFIPGDLEFSVANFLLMGTPDQLMDLSVTHPYPGDCKLVERLLGMKEVSDQYRKLLKELASTAFSKERLAQDIEAIEKATKEPLAKEKKSVDARKEKQGGFGPGGFGPQPPSLATFVEKRSASIADQLAGKSKGYVPAGFGFGPPKKGPGGGGGPPAVLPSGHRRIPSTKRNFAIS